MAGFLIYSLITGQLVRVGSVPDGEELAQVSPDEGIMLDFDPSVSGDTHYVSLGPPPVVILKNVMAASSNKTFIKADGVDAATISSIPVATSFLIDGSFNRQIDDGVVVFKSDEFGPVLLQFVHPSYQPKDIQINVGCVVATLTIDDERVMPSGIVSMIDISSEAPLSSASYLSLTGGLIINDETMFSPTIALFQTSDSVIVEDELVFQPALGMNVEGKDYLVTISDLVVESELTL